MAETGLSASAKRHWHWVAIGTLVLIIVSIVLTPIAETRLSPERVGAVGLVLGAWGIALAVLGFAITIVQLDRAQQATAAVAAAIQKMKRDYGTFDVSTEIRSAYRASDETLRHIEDGRWRPAASSYEEASKSLYKLAAITGGLSAEQLAEAKAHNVVALDAISMLEGFAGEAGDPAVVQMRMGLRELNGFLITLEVTQKENIGGQ